MGAIADAFAAYAQPLLDQTDGSEGQLNKAFTISQLCYNLALMPEDSRDQMLSEMTEASCQVAVSRGDHEHRRAQASIAHFLSDDRRSTASRSTPYK